MSERLNDGIGAIEHQQDLAIMARGTVVALLGGIAGSVIGWFGQLVLARLLGPGGFGSYSMGIAMVHVAAQVSTLGLPSATIYFVSRYSQEDAAKVHAVLLQSIGATLSAGSIVGLLLFLLSPLAASHLFHSPDLTPMLRVFALTIGFTGAFRAARAATTISYRLSYRAFLDIFFNGCFVLIFIVFYLLGGRLGGATIAFLLSTSLGFGASIYLLIQLFPNFLSRSRPSLPILHELFAYSLPAFAAAMLWAPQDWMDRLLVGHFRPPAEVGFYQAAHQSVSPLYSTSLAVSSIAAPMIASLFNQGERARLRDVFRVSSKCILYSTLIVFAVIIVAPVDVLRMFFGLGYENGVTPVLGQKLNPNVVMMQPAEDWNRGDAAELLRAPGIWRILVQREMRPDFVVI